MTTMSVAYQAARFLEEALLRADMLCRVAEHAGDTVSEYEDVMRPAMRLYRQDILDLRARAVRAEILDSESVDQSPISAVLV